MNSRTADRQRLGGHVLDHDGTRGHERSFSDLYSRQNSGVRSNTGVRADRRSDEVNLGPNRVRVIEQRRVRSEEDPVADGRLARDIRPRLEARAVADGGRPVDDRLGPDRDIVAEGGLLPHQHVMPRPESGARDHVVVDYRSRPDRAIGPDDRRFRAFAIGHPDGRVVGDPERAVRHGHR